MIVTLCGSTRFMNEFHEWNARLSLQGHVVFSVAVGKDKPLTEADKAILDAVHKKKIELADAIVVLNKDGYYGDSTRSEIAYAMVLGKTIFWLEPTHVPDADGVEEWLPPSLHSYSGEALKWRPDPRLQGGGAGDPA